MKLAIKPYILSLLRENITYVILCVFLFVMEIVFIFFNFNKVTANTDKINQLTQETTSLKNKVSSLNAIQFTQDELDSYVKLLNKLIPNTEDYFSIIYTLDRLSKSTNFIITSYNINLTGSNQNQLKLTITGTGNRDAFLQFLKDYNFGGGRLITSDKIELSQQFSGQLKVDITFYNNNVTLDPNKTINFSPSLIDDLKNLKNKVNLSSGVATNEGQLDLNYPRKLNPF